MTVQGHDIAFIERLDLGTDEPRILDVGANVGEMTQLYLRRWPNARIACFEPNPAAYRRLDEAMFLDAPNVELHSVALSDRVGWGKLHFAGGPDETASLHERDLSYAGVELHPHSVTVKVGKLGEYVSEEVIDLLKIDAEGHELQVLRGCPFPLLRPARIKRIAFEFNSCNLDSRTFLKDFWDLLVVERGYALFRIDSSGELELVESYDPSLEDFAAHREFLAVGKVSSKVTEADIERGRELAEQFGWD